MTIYILSVIALVVALIYVKRKITEISKNVEDKVNNAKAVITHPKFFVGIIGRILLAQALGKITKIFRR